jgi:hypothetical protein
MTLGEELQVRLPWPGDAGARRLYELVRGACAEADDFPGRLATGLRAALEMLAADPELAHLLTVQPYLGGDDGALDAQRDWIDRFGDLLRDAAAADAQASREPSFVAPFLIGGVRFQIARLILAGDCPDLSRHMPEILEAVLAYYFEPGEPRRLARAALAGQDEIGNGEDLPRPSDSSRA